MSSGELRATACRDLAPLGLLVLGYGLVLSPLVHALVQHGALAPPEQDSPWVTHRSSAPEEAHDETRPHTHGPGAPSHPHERGEVPHSHGAFSVEHLQAVPLPASAPLLAVGLLLTLCWVLQGEARAEAAQRLALLPAMAQGP